MSATTNLGLELVDPASNEIFDYQKYVVDNFKIIDNVNIGNRLDALETNRGNLRLYSGTYTGNGATEWTRSWARTSFVPQLLFIFPVSGGRPTSNTLCITCAWPDTEPTGIDVSALRAFIPLGSGQTPNDHTHVDFYIATPSTTTYCYVHASVDEGTSPANIMNESGVHYKYILLGAKL